MKKILLALAAIALCLALGYMAGKVWLSETSEYAERKTPCSQKREIESNRKAGD